MLQALFQIPQILHCLQTKGNLLATGVITRGFRTCFELNFVSPQIHTLQSWPPPWWGGVGLWEVTGGLRELSALFQLCPDGWETHAVHQACERISPGADPAALILRTPVPLMSCQSTGLCPGCLTGPGLLVKWCLWASPLSNYCVCPCN